MTLKELMEWMAFYELEPWGNNVDGLRMASNTAAVYNAGLMMADPKKLRTKPFLPKQFYIGINEGKKKPQTWQDQRKRLEMAFPRGKSK